MEIQGWVESLRTQRQPTSQTLTYQCVRLPHISGEEALER